MTEGTMTELELAKLENFALKHANMQQAINANLAARNAYIREVEAAHPGYTFSEQTGQLVKAAPPEPQPQALRVNGKITREPRHSHP
jgi:hypothetical protein